MMKEWSTKSLYIILVLLGFGMGFASMALVYVLGFHWETDAWFILSMLPITAGAVVVFSILITIALHELWTRTRDEEED